MRFLEFLAGDETVQQSVLEETWCLPASSEILPKYADAASVTEDSLKSPYKAAPVDYALLDEILKNAVVIRRFGGYEDILNKLDSEIREAGNSSGNFAVTLRRISNTMETYTGKR